MDWHCEIVEVRVLAGGYPLLKVGGHSLYPEANTLRVSGAIIESVLRGSRKLEQWFGQTLKELEEEA